MENNKLQEYEKHFGKRPPLIMEFPYENEDYQKLMEKALILNEEITEDSISDYIKENNIEYGIVGGREDLHEEETPQEFTLSKETIELLKTLPNGKELLINAPSMSVDEFKEKAKEIINKGE